MLTVFIYTLYPKKGINVHHISLVFSFKPMSYPNNTYLVIYCYLSPSVTFGQSLATRISCFSFYAKQQI